MRYLLLGIAWTQPGCDPAHAQDHNQSTSKALIVYRSAASIDPIFASLEEESITQLT